MISYWDFSAHNYLCLQTLNIELIIISEPSTERALVHQQFAECEERAKNLGHFGETSYTQ